MFENLIPHLLMAAGVSLFAEKIGKLLLQYRSDYQPLASLFTTEGSVGFNAVYRILIAPVSIVILSIALYLLGADSLVENIWLVAVWYFLFNLLLILLLNRATLLNKPKFFSYHLISIALTYYLYNALILKGLNHLLPDEANLRTDMWLIIAAFFYGVFKVIPENQEKFKVRKEKYVASSIQKFEKNYCKWLNKYDFVLRQVLLSIMVYEDFNRPKTARILEDITNAKTRGIMQVVGAKNDKESIAMAAKILKPGLGELKSHTPGTYEYNVALYNILNKYNPADPTYAGRVAEIYELIRNQRV